MLLRRSGVKGNFVLFPKHWDKRWMSPNNRRFQTGCDMVIGGCACGRHHRGDDEETQRLLECYDAEVESLHEWRTRTSQERIAEENEQLT